MSVPIRYKHRIEYALLRTAVFFINCFPVRLILLFCTATGWLAWIVVPFRLRVTTKNMRLAFADHNRQQRMRLLRSAYIEVCRTFGIVFILHRRRVQQMITEAAVDGIEILKKAHAEGRGVILTTCHACWFEACFAWFNRSSLPTTLIYQKQRNPLANAFFLAARQRGSSQLDHVTSNEKLAVYERILRQKRILIVSLDQNYREKGTPVSFFGHTFSCAKGAGLLHLKTGAPVLSCVYWMENERLHLAFKKVYLPEYHQTDEVAINDVCARAVRHFEPFFRSHPEQWFSLYHRLWSKKRAFYPRVKRTIRDIFGQTGKPGESPARHSSR